MNKNKPQINRRAFLYAAGTTGIALPFLEGLPERSAFAQASGNPVFGFFMCASNGVVQKAGNDPEKFWPTDLGELTTAGMQAFADDRCTGLLADHADKLLIVKGINYPVNNGGCGHANGLVLCLTGRGPSGGGNTATSTGISVDTAASDALNPTGVSPLTLYSGLKEGYINERLSFSAAGKVRSAEGNPYATYQRLTGLVEFTDGTGTGGGSGTGGAGTGGNPIANDLTARRKSVNDLVRDQINDLKNKPQLSRADRDRLDLHFTSIRDIEVTMQNMATTACSDELLDMDAMTALNTGMAFRQNGRIEEVVALQADLVALTFSCNANRVATLQAGDGTDQTRYNINGQTVERFHWVSHRVQSDGSSGAAIPQALEWHTEIDRIRMRTFASILDKWSQYGTPNGPLLDNAFFLWTNAVATGPQHGFSNLPVIIAGNAGGYLKTGQYVDAGGTSNATLLNTLLNAMGVESASFGQNGSGVIDELLA